MYRHTHTQDNYCNPRCACTPRVNNVGNQDLCANTSQEEGVSSASSTQSHEHDMGKLIELHTDFYKFDRYVQYRILTRKPNVDPAYPRTCLCDLIISFKLHG